MNWKYCVLTLNEKMFRLATPHMCRLVVLCEVSVCKEFFSNINPNLKSAPHTSVQWCGSFQVANVFFYELILFYSLTYSRPLVMQQRLFCLYRNRQHMIHDESVIRKIRLMCENLAFIRIGVHLLFKSVCIMCKYSCIWCMVAWVCTQCLEAPLRRTRRVSVSPEFVLFICWSTHLGARIYFCTAHVPNKIQHKQYHMKFARAWRIGWKIECDFQCDQSPLGARSALGTICYADIWWVRRGWQMVADDGHVCFVMRGRDNQNIVW